MAATILDCLKAANCLKWGSAMVAPWFLYEMVSQNWVHTSPVKLVIESVKGVCLDRR